MDEQLDLVQYATKAEAEAARQREVASTEPSTGGEPPAEPVPAGPAQRRTE